MTHAKALNLDTVDAMPRHNREWAASCVAVRDSLALIESNFLEALDAALS